jgi:acetoacetyl-CoA synthetase
MTAVSSTMVDGEVLWTPGPHARQDCEMGRFLTWVERRHGLSFADYQAAWQWSVDELEDFWQAIADYMPVRFHTPPERVLADRHMPGTTWFPGATLNYAEHAFVGDPDQSVLVSLSESRDRRELTRAELLGQVGAVRRYLESIGVERGDRVAAYLPNIPEALVVLFAAASMGAVFTSCAPESGTTSVISKIGQVEPKVLFTIDGYRYGGKAFSRLAESAAIRDAVPSITHVVEVPYLDPRGPRVPDAADWRDVVAEPTAPSFDPLPFDHPLYIVYSSGTTGQPKAIIHSHGGILFEHLKLFRLHDDLGPGDRWFWYSSTNWVAWNYGASVFMTGASLVTYDGHITKPDLAAYWERIADEGITWLGTSPGFLGVCQKAGIVPREICDLSSLRTLNSGGSPLGPEGWRWIYQAIKDDIYVSSGSGGTDVAGCFVSGCRLLPVRVGEIACRLLGVDAQAVDDLGQVVIGERGELVIRAPMPSMPVGFWDDPDGARLHQAYFERFDGIWCHGDWVLFLDRGSCIVMGRSDATLNRGGVRLGTSEFYSVLDDLDEVADSMVIHLEGDYGDGGELLLFVVIAEGHSLDDEVRARVAASLRGQLSPRHVPDRIVEVDLIPRTLTGKRMEVPIKRLLLDPEAALVSDAGVGMQGIEEFREVARGLTADAPASTA